MTARIIGAVLIGAVSLYVGGAFCSMWQHRVQQLLSFGRLAEALGDGIGTMGLSVRHIVESFSDTVLENTGFLPAARTVWNDDPTAAALGTALASCLPRLSLESEELALLSSFFDRLGSEDRERECARCGYVHARLQALHEAAAGALSARCRIARTLSGAVGCAAALMLL